MFRCGADLYYRCTSGLLSSPVKRAERGCNLCVFKLSIICGNPRSNKARSVPRALTFASGFRPGLSLWILPSTALKIELQQFNQPLYFVNKRFSAFFVRRNRSKRLLEFNGLRTFPAGMLDSLVVLKRL